MTGAAGRDRRGIWINDPCTGTRFRLGEVGQEMAYTMTEAGHTRAAREILSRPHLGVWFAKTF